MKKKSSPVVFVRRPGERCGGLPFIKLGYSKLTWAKIPKKSPTLAEGSQVFFGWRETGFWLADEV